MSFLFIKKTLRFDDLKIGTAINAKISVFVICVEAIIYLLLRNLHDCTFNPGPQNKSDINFSICHWNLNSIAIHNYAKGSLLKSYIAVYKFDKVCISETYLDSSITSDDGNLEILRYNLIRSNHPSNSRRGGVCIYYNHPIVSVVVFAFIIKVLYL